MRLWARIVCRTATGLVVAAAVLAWTGSWWWALGGLLGTGVVMNSVGNRRNWQPPGRGAC